MLKTAGQLMVAAAACAVGFVILLLAVYGTGRGAYADAVALAQFGDLQRPLVARVCDAISHLADPGPFAIFAAAIVVYGWAHGRYAQAAGAATLLLGANLSTQLVLKPLLVTPRGTVGDYFISTEAFPSGHATASMSLALAAMLVAPAARRPLIGALGTIFALSVGFSIVSLDWHFPSDVAGGYLVAGTWCFGILAALAARGLLRRPDGSADWTGPGLLLLGAVVAVAAVGASRLPNLTGYAEGHTTFVVVASGTAVLAAVITAGAILGASGPGRRAAELPRKPWRRRARPRSEGPRRSSGPLRALRRTLH